jgi:hypothetical protein
LQEKRYKKEERREKKEEPYQNSPLSHIVGEKLRLEIHPEDRKSSPECFARPTRTQTKDHPKKKKINPQKTIAPHHP